MGWVTIYDENGRAPKRWVADSSSRAKPPPPGPYHRTPTAKDPFAAWTGNAQSEALQILEAFAAALGWPKELDDDHDTLMRDLLQNGLYLSPEQAYNWLFARLSPTLQQLNPGAEFGLGKDAYVQQLNALTDQWEFYTGTTDLPHDVMRMAIDQGWTQQELLDFLQKDKRFSDPAKLPWLQQGMGFRDVKNQFFQIYGKNPTSPDQLASWFNFRLGASQMAGTPGAQIQTGQGPQRGISQSEIR